MNEKVKAISHYNGEEFNKECAILKEQGYKMQSSNYVGSGPISPLFMATFKKPVEPSK